MDPSSDPSSAIPRMPHPGGVLLPGRRAKPVTEVFAGVTLAALALPLNIGYAEAAGLPAIVGINAAILPVVAFALFSGSRQLVIGPDATVAALLAGIIPALAAETGDAPTELALGVAMLTGVVLIVLWALRRVDGAVHLEVGARRVPRRSRHRDPDVPDREDHGRERRHRRVAHRRRRDRPVDPGRLGRERRGGRVDDRAAAAAVAVRARSCRVR